MALLSVSAELSRRRAPSLGDRWHLDEAVVTINGKRHILWRAVEKDGFVLDVLVQKRRDTNAAKRFMNKLLSGQGTGLNNRAENSHQPVRRRERIVKRFKSARHVQRFTSIHDPIHNLHYFPRDKFSSADHRELRQAATTMWREIACLKSA